MPLNSKKDQKWLAYRPKKKERKRRDELLTRILELKNFRKTVASNTVNNVSIEKVWDKADRLYPPHVYENEGLKDWQSKVSQPLGYVKLQTALSLMIDQNPSVELLPRAKHFEAKVDLFKSLYDLSFERGNGKQAFRKFTFNCGKYGWGVGRTYHRKDTRTIKELRDYSPDSDLAWDKKEYVDFDDVYFEPLEVRDAWLDSNTKPDDYLSTNDWCWRKTYDYSTFNNVFGHLSNAKYIRPGKPIEEGKDEVRIDYTGKDNQVELYFYENKEDDEFMIMDSSNSVLLLDSVLPYEHKQLSLVHTYWTLRSTDCPFGVGLMEIIEGKQELLDRITNMRMDQVMLMIYKMFFYGGAEDLGEEDLEIEPGKGVKVYDTNNIQFYEVPGPGRDAYREEDVLRTTLDEDTGITKTLSGQPVGKTAFEASINRESGLRRMSIPLENIESAMTREAQLRIDLIPQIYREPIELRKMVDGPELEAAKAEMAALGDKASDFFATDQESGDVFKKEFRRVRLPFSKKPEGTLEFTGEEQIITLTPEDVRFSADVKVVARSTIPVSKALMQKQKLDMFSLIAQLPYTDIKKAQENIVKTYDEKPRDWMMSDEQIALQQQLAAAGPGSPGGSPGGQKPLPKLGAGQDVGAGLNQLISNTNEAL